MESGKEGGPADGSEIERNTLPVRLESDFCVKVKPLVGISKWFEMTDQGVRLQVCFSSQ